MANSYRHLTYEQRCQIDTLKERGDSLSSIAIVLNVHPSTISRELKRNTGQRGYRYKHKKNQLLEGLYPQIRKCLTFKLYKSF